MLAESVTATSSSKVLPITLSSFPTYLLPHFTPFVPFLIAAALRSCLTAVSGVSDIRQQVSRADVGSAAFDSQASSRGS